jgi:hypothetical protein
MARHGCERQRRPELENGQDPERTSRICALAKPTAKSQEQPAECVCDVALVD